ncbi:MAG: sugar phosphate isomerase/epimerase [Spirochaetes bacterium]|nr:sugar phosphate isomerase/epimerase [Spirochaetota bacterium]
MNATMKHIDPHTKITSSGRRFPGLRAALNAYSFHLRLGGSKKASATMTLYHALAFCAANNIPAVDATAYFFPGYPDVPGDAALNAFKREALRMGVCLSGTGIRNDFVTADANVRAEGVALAKKWIEAAARLGAPVLRVFAGAALPPDETAEGMKRLTDCLHQCAEYGSKHGVVIGVQNHGDFLQTADRCIDVVKRIDSPWLGLVVDTGNFKTPDPYADIARVVPYAVNWQIKESPLGIGNKQRTDIEKLLGIIHAGGYRGFVPIETIERENPEYDLAAELAWLLDAFENAQSA